MKPFATAAFAALFLFAAAGSAFAKDDPDAAKRKTLEDLQRVRGVGRSTACRVQEALR